MAFGIDFSTYHVLQDLTPEQQDALCAKAELIEVAKGEIVSREGEPADHVFFLVEGKIDLESTTFQNTAIVMDVLRPGDFFGWSAILGSDKLTASSHCRTDVKAIKLSAEDLADFLQNDSEIGFVVMTRIAQTVARRLTEARERISQLLSG